MNGDLDSLWRETEYSSTHFIVVGTSRCVKMNRVRCTHECNVIFKSLTFLRDINKQKKMVVQGVALLITTRLLNRPTLMNCLSFYNSYN